jgi:hypothetical protein
VPTENSESGRGKCRMKKFTIYYTRVKNIERRNYLGSSGFSLANIVRTSSWAKTNRRIIGYPIFKANLVLNQSDGTSNSPSEVTF